MKKFILILAVLSICIIVLFIASNKTIAQEGQKHSASDSCLECHGNAAKMKELGFPQFTMTHEEVAKQTGMPATCTNPTVS